MASHKQYPPDESELSNGVFKYLEPTLDAAQAANGDWSTLYDCKVNFASLRASVFCTELIDKKELDKARDR